MPSNKLATVQPTTVTETIQIGKVLAESGFFNDAQGAAQAVAKILAGQELGFGPMASMTGIHIVKGKVTLSANLLAAAIKKHPKYNYIIEHLDDSRCRIHFHENGQSIGESSFSLEDAKQANLINGDNWRKYPRNMLFARAISNGAKWYCPDILGGPIYTPDEFDLPVNEQGEAQDAAIEHRQAGPTNKPQPKHLPRPWDPETLRAYMQERAGTDSTTPTDEEFRRMHAAISTLTNGNEEKRRQIQMYLFDAGSSTELSAGEVETLYRWIATTKDKDTGEWIPSSNAVKEMHAVVRAHQKEAGQLDLLEDSEA